MGAEGRGGGGVAGGEERAAQREGAKKTETSEDFSSEVCLNKARFRGVRSSRTRNPGVSVFRRLKLCLCGACVLVWLAGCGGGAMQQPPPPPPPQITGVSVAPQSVAIEAGATTQFTATVTGDATNSVTWSVNGVAGGNSTTGTIDASGNYTAPQGTGVAVTITATSTKDTTKSGNASAKGVAPGTYAATNNAQVVQYTVTTPADAKVSVEFGLDTNYGTPTWQQATPAGGGAVSLFVAGMKANTTYHMRGVVAFNDGSIFKDADHTFAVPSLPAGVLPTITTTTAGTRQSGVEVLDLLSSGSKVDTVITDLDGNPIWSYDPGLGSGVIPQPIKLLPNGDFLLNFAAGQPDGANSQLQEVDLGGNLKWSLSAAQLNAALSQATCSGCNINVVGTHHDAVLLPNGHIIVIAALLNTTVVQNTTVTGDVIIDLDQNRTPVWVWNEFDHLDINRRPLSFPDWTHTNAVIYSPDDGNLIVSIRNQNWLVKVNYANGTGDGSILWKLGFQGDFILQDSQGVADNDPTHWFFAQHGPSFTTSNTAGKFGLILFDNGDDRGYPVTTPSPGSCGVTGQPACFSTIPMLSIDEGGKTATVTLHPSAQVYSFFGGNAEVLKNGHIEYCESTTNPATDGDIYEITADNNPSIIWNLHVTGQTVYRGFRLPSLYPGVQW